MNIIIDFDQKVDHVCSMARFFHFIPFYLLGYLYGDKMVNVIFRGESTKKNLWRILSSILMIVIIFSCKIYTKQEVLIEVVSQADIHIKNFILILLF